MALIKKYDNQSTFDFLLQHAGGISGLFDFLNANGLQDIDVPEGEYIAPGILNAQVANVFYKDLGGVAAPIVYSMNVNVDINGSPFIIYPAATSQNILLVDENNLPIVPVSSTGGTVVVALNNSTAPATVHNSDNSYTASLNPGDDLELDDIEILAKNSLNVTIETLIKPSAVDGVINLSDVNHTDYDGTIVSTPAGVSFNASTPLPATVHNSDNSYIASLNPGDDIELADITVKAKNSLGVTVASDIIVSAVDCELNLPDVTHTDSDGTPVSTPSGESFVCTPGGTLLPSGTYTPKNTVTGAFDLLWHSPTNVTTGTGTLTKASGSTLFNASAGCVINHTGDFELKFKLNFTGKNAFFGLSFQKISNIYQGLSFAWYRTNTDLIYIYENGTTVYSSGSVFTPTSVFSLKRIGSSLQYLVNGTLHRTVTLTNVGPMDIDGYIQQIGVAITDIQVII